MQLKRIMTYECVVIGAEAGLQKAAQLMAEYDVDVLPVCEGGRLIGILTGWDIITRAVAARRDPASTLVRDVMTADVVHCFEDQEAIDAYRLMEERRIHRIPILSRDKRLAGIISKRDLQVCHVITG